jgi:hypothetical protein
LVYVKNSLKIPPDDGRITAENAEFLALKQVLHVIITVLETGRKYKRKCGLNLRNPKMHHASDKWLYNTRV